MKKLEGEARPRNISSGAYYRQLRQCRDKVDSILYSMILLQSTEVVGSDVLNALSRIAEQLRVIFASESSDITRDITRQRVADVISVIETLVKKMSNL